MKNAIKSFASLLLFANAGYGLAANKGVAIDHKLIKAIDGSNRVNIVKMLKIEVGVQDLLKGQKGNGMVPFEGKNYTINELAVHEQNLRNRKTFIDHKPAIKIAVDQAITQFEEITAAYMKEAQGWKRETLMIIKQWLIQTDRKDSLLLGWGNQEEGTEYEETRKMIPDFAHLKSFLEDIWAFMRDLRFSCKKSYKMYLNSLREEGLLPHKKKDASEHEDHEL